MITPIENLTQRLAALEREIASLRGALARVVNPAILTTARDVRLIKTCEVPGEEEDDDPTYAEPGDNVFPFRFIDATFTPADEPGSVAVDSTDRSVADDEISYGLAIDATWLPPHTLAAALWQPGLQTDAEAEEDGESGEWWILAGPQLAIGKSNGTIAKGSSSTQGTIFLYDGDEEDTERELAVRNRFRNVADEKWCVAATINGHWYLIAAECD